MGGLPTAIIIAGEASMGGEMTEDELKQQLTAAEEQLAAMRGIVEQMLRLHEAEEADDLWVTCPSCNGGQTIGDRMCPTCGGVGCDLKEGIGPVWEELFAMAKQALSAAPKRGRVVWEGEGKASFRDGELRAIVLPKPGMDDKVPNFFHRARDWLAKVGGDIVTVTVREAE